MYNMDEEAVSEAIGFIIMFSIVLAGIGLVILYGYPLLLQSQISSDERTMEQAMVTVQNDMKLLTYGNVPFSDTVLRVSGGTISILPPSECPQSFSVESYAADTGEWKPLVPPVSVRTGEVRYISDDGPAVISIDNGAVVKRMQGSAGAVMLAKPRWFVDVSDDKKTLLLGFMILNSESSGFSGVGTLMMSRTDPVVISPLNLNATDIRITYCPDHVNDFSGAWQNYFRELGRLEGDDSVVIEKVDTVIIKEYNITVRVS